MIKMKVGVLLIMLTFASDENEAENAKSEEKKKFPEDLILVKIEEEEYAKAPKKTSSIYIGVSYYSRDRLWEAIRWNKDENKMVHNGRYKNEETAACASDTLARKLMRNGEQSHKLNFPIDMTEVHAEKKNPSSIYFGVCFNRRHKAWEAKRHSRDENKTVHNGCYKDEETAAYASDTLARKLMPNGEQNPKLNFPKDITEVHPEKKKTSIYFGVCFCKKNDTWEAKRWSKDESKAIYNGRYKNEETAAQASDTLARQLNANGEQSHKLNFPNDMTEVHPEKKNPSSIYFGVSYYKRDKTWEAKRRSRDENKMVHKGYYKDEETAAHASDTLARKLMANGEQNHTLNFPNDISEEFHQRHKRKRSDHKYLEHSQNK